MAAAFTTDAARALPGPPWLVERRVAAAEALTSAPMPHATDEVWRYSPIDRLDLDAYRPPAAAAGVPDLPPLVRSLVDSLGSRSGLVVTVDGLVASLDAPGLDVGEATPELLDLAERPDDALTALADAVAGGPLAVRIPRGKVVEGPIVLVHLVTGRGVVAAPQLVVHVGEAAEASVVELWAGGEGGALVLPSTSVVLDQAANLRYGSVQALAPEAWSIAHHATRVGRDATMRGLAVALGGSYARMRADATLDGQGGSSSLLAAYLGGGDQVLDFRTMQHHVSPRTRSELLFKGAVGDRSHGVYSGLIRIRHGAKGTAAFQTNRNLVLSDGAGADSVPNLEIDENDVSCSHASAVGPIDDQQRFYLEARGVPPRVADRLIVLGFLDEVLARSPIAGLRGPVALELAARVEAVAA